ncbi:MAG: hypothetical protein LBS68_02320 [Puniceicoccales bacterium]|jgi:hypothetical protein|nr:hypothetical protein [Puniceicoccales bacterium]
MGNMTICEYAASPLVNAYVNLKEEFRKAKEFRKNATPGNTPAQPSAPDAEKPSGMAYLVFAGTVVTLLAPLKIVGCSASLLLNYAYSPVAIIFTGLLLLLRKIGWAAKDSTAETCIVVVALWPIFISAIVASLTTNKNTDINGALDSPIYLEKLHFLQSRLAYLLKSTSA